MRSKPFAGDSTPRRFRATGLGKLTERVGRIAQGQSKQGERRASVLWLLFERGARPNAADIVALALGGKRFAVSNRAEGNGVTGVTWLELLINGLTFDLRRLAPDEPEGGPEFLHLFDLPRGSDPNASEAVTLEPGPHLNGGEHLLPVVRSQMALAVELASLPRIAAVGWEPARSVSSAAYFSRSVTRWLEGGTFPGLGLTALAETQDGGLRSEGLAFFTGQELAIASELAQDKPAAAKLALRLIHQLVEAGGLAAADHVIGPEGDALMLELVENGQIVRVSKA